MHRYLLLLAALTLVFFAPLVVRPTSTLYSEHSDLLAEHLPAKHFLVRSWRETGELPLWNPHHFCGSPLIHDIQVAAFYPLHLALVGVPEAYLGAALSWLVVLHVFLAGAGMLLYARFRGLQPPAAFLAALGFMFAGKWLLHLLGGGHYILLGLAWLPFVLLAFEHAVREGSLRAATLAGVCFALLVLCTHPQWTFYSGLFVAAWSFGAVLEAGLSRRALLRWLGLGVWTAGIALALAAVQLLPTLEAARHSSRSVAGMNRELLSELLFPWQKLFGPALGETAWENHGGLGFVLFALAVLAPWLRRGRSFYDFALLLVIILFGCGGGWVVQEWPGFRVFRHPARALSFAALPVALLAASAVQSLGSTVRLSPWQRRAIVLGVLLAAAVSFSVEWIALGFTTPQLYWATLLVTAPLLVWLVGIDAARWRIGWVWTLLILVDLWGLAWPLVEVRPDTEVLSPPKCVDFLAERPATQGRVLDLEHPDRYLQTPLGTGAPQALLHGLHAVRGYNPLDVHVFKEFIHFVSGNDAPVVPFEVLDSFPIRERALLNLLQVRYLLLPDDLSPPGAGWHVVHHDAAVEAYCYPLGGRLSLGGWTVHENERVLPRAFSVSLAEPYPPRSELLARLRSTDFRRVVFMDTEEATPETGEPEFALANITRYEPNRVVVQVERQTPGFLVLSDVWYPGWTATVDGTAARVLRANHTFRAVAVPAGAHEVEFRFEPTSYRRGRQITFVALLVVACVLLFRRRIPTTPPE
jgi:hypothetical protein